MDNKNIMFTNVLWFINVQTRQVWSRNIKTINLTLKKSFLQKNICILQSRIY